MNKEFIPYEQALALKELGYVENRETNKSFGFYCEGVFYLLYRNHQDNQPDNVYREVDAPLYQQVFRWFREEFQLEQSITFNHITRDYHVMIMYRYSTEADGWIPSINTYEEAELACLRKLIEIVKDEDKKRY